VFLFFAGVMSAAESAFFSLPASFIEAKRKSRLRSERHLLILLANPRLSIAAITAWRYFFLIIGVTFFSFAIPFSDVLIALLYFVVFVLGFFFIGIALPKIYGSTHAITLSPRMASACFRLVQLSKVFLQPFLKLSDDIEQKIQVVEEQRSVKELEQALELAAAHKDTTESEKEILKGIINFGTYTVREVMRPQQEIYAADISFNFHDLLLYIRKSGFSRIPVYRDTVNNIQGILYIKDLIPYMKESKSFYWQKLLRPAFYVSENKKIDLLLKDFQEKRVHLALTVNDTGTIAGIITLEDIIEEIIGDIHDEFDEAGAYVRKIDEFNYVIDSNITLTEFCRLLDLQRELFGAHGEDDDTLATFLKERQPNLRRRGDKMTLEPVTFTVEAVDQQRIRKVRVHIAQENSKE